MGITAINNIEIWLTLTVLAGAVLTGVTVYIGNPKSWTNKLFLFLAVYIAIYDVTNFFSLHPPGGTPENQLFWIRIVMAVSAFIGPLLLFFAASFPKNDFGIKKKFWIPILTFASTIAIISFTPLIFKTVTYLAGQPLPIAGPAIYFYWIDFVGIIIASFIILIIKYKKSNKEEKDKYSWLLTGIIISFFFFIVATFISVNVFKTSNAVSLGPTFFLILLFFIAYSIVKHQLFDIRLAIARAVSYLFVIAIIALVYAAILLFGTELLFGYEIPAKDLIFDIITASIIALSFQPLHKIIEKLTDKIFFRSEYNTEELLTRISNITSGTIDLEVLTTVILRILLIKIHVSKGAFLIIDEHKIINIRQIGFTDYKLAAPELELLFHYLPFYKIFIFEDMEEGELKKFFRQLDIKVALPIRVETNEVAILILGPKSSGEIYSKRDINTLNILTSQVGIAIQNAKSYSLLQQFNQELEKKVEERTKELKNTQEKELAKAKEIVRLKDEFVFIAAHELQTPVTVIRGFLDLVSEASAKFPKDIQEHLNSMKTASGNLSQLISDLLEIARSEANTIKIEVKPISAAFCLKEEIKKFRQTAGERGIKINVKIPGRSPKIMADLVKTKEVISNLLSNAVKYNKEKGAIDLTVIERDDDVVIEVRDTGYGIPEKEQGKIFQKFFRSVGRETFEVTGTGLGLFITRMLVEKMGGKIMFSSVEGKGSTFAFSLPKAKI